MPLCAAAALLGVLGGAMAGCGTDTAAARPAPPARPGPEPSPPVEVAEPDAAEAPMLPPVLPEGHVRVHGIVFGRTDNGAGLTQRPFETGMLVAVPVERYDGFVARATGPWRGRVLEGKGFPIPPALLEAPDVDSCKLDADGTYTLTIRPGAYKFCVGNLRAAGDAGAAASVFVDTGFDVTVTEEEFQTVVAVLDRDRGEVTIYH